MVEKNTKTKSVWNSLEITKIFVGLLTPIAIFLFTWQTNKNINESNKIEDNNKRVFQQRQDIYNKIGPLLNDIYSYYMYVGQWKQLSPIDIIKNKRELDKIIYTNIPYFDTASSFLESYNSFMNAAFSTYQGWGKDALLRTNSRLHYAAIDTSLIRWQSEWNSMFTEQDNRTEIKAFYFALLRHVSAELNLEVKGHNIESVIKLKTIDTLNSGIPLNP